MSELHRMLVGFAIAGVFVTVTLLAIGIAAGTRSALVPLAIMAAIMLAASTACGVGAFWEMRGKPNAPRSTREWFGQYFTNTMPGLRLGLYALIVPWILALVMVGTAVQSGRGLRFAGWFIAALALATSLSFYRYRTKNLKRWLGWRITLAYFGALAALAVIAAMFRLPTGG